MIKQEVGHWTELKRPKSYGSIKLLWYEKESSAYDIHEAKEILTFAWGRTAKQLEVYISPRSNKSKHTICFLLRKRVVPYAPLLLIDIRCPCPCEMPVKAIPSQSYHTRNHGASVLSEVTALFPQNPILRALIETQHLLLQYMYIHTLHKIEYWDYFESSSPQLVQVHHREFSDMLQVLNYAQQRQEVWGQAYKKQIMLDPVLQILETGFKGGGDKMKSYKSGTLNNWRKKLETCVTTMLLMSYSVRDVWEAMPVFLTHWHPRIVRLKGQPEDGRRYGFEGPRWKLLIANQLIDNKNTVPLTLPQKLAQFFKFMYTYFDI